MRTSPRPKSTIGSRPVRVSDNPTGIYPDQVTDRIMLLSEFRKRHCGVRATVDDSECRPQPESAPETPY